MLQTIDFFNDVLDYKLKKFLQAIVIIFHNIIYGGDWIAHMTKFLYIVRL